MNSDQSSTETNNGGIWSWALCAVIVATFFEALSFTVLYPVLPKFVLGVGGDLAAVGLVIGAFNIVAILYRTLGGLLSDRWGRKPLLVVGGLISTIALVGLLWCSSLTLLVPLRMLHGAAEAAFYVSAAAAVTDLVPRNRRSAAISIFSLAFLVAFSVGPLLGERLTLLSFDIAWMVAAGFSITAAAISVLIVLPAITSEAPSGDLLGHRRALFPGALFAATLVGYAGFTAYASLYAETFSPDLVGMLFLTYGIVMGATRLLAGGLPDLLGPRLVAVVAMVGSAAGLLMLGSACSPSVAILATAIFACGQALCFPALLSIALHGATDAQRGRLVGTFTAFLDIGLTVGALLFGAIVAGSSVAVAFSLSALLTLAAAAALQLSERSDRSAK